MTAQHDGGGIEELGAVYHSPGVANGLRWRSRPNPALSACDEKHLNGLAEFDFRYNYRVALGTKAAITGIQGNGSPIINLQQAGYQVLELHGSCDAKKKEENRKFLGCK